ncbi:MAG: tetratricopeptide repeat protein [Pirellulaceae bacterium]|nr:tetratricopeptide repeat protein [Pirellulaceae bacterium]
MNFPVTNRLATLGVIVLLSGLGEIAAQSVDQIQTTSGSRLEGSVTAVTPVEVTIDVRGSKRGVPVNEIKYVAFADDPPELKAGRNRILAGKFATGLADLKKINPADVQGELVKRDLQFYLALATSELALSAGGDKTQASAAMLAFVRAAPNSYHFFDAAQMLGDLALAQQDAAGAARYYGAISSKAPWPEYKMAALMSEARALISQGEFAAAQKKYESVLSAKSDTKESRRQKLFAQIGRGRCLAETSAPQEGIDLIEEVIAKNDPADSELFGRAYNALGDCLLKAGKTKDALMAYLHVDVLFYSDPEIHAESLYYLTKLWSATKNNDRSIAARKMLDDRYAGSIWASKP